MSIRIVLVDDHSVVRIGMKSVLELDREFKCVGEASGGAEALEVVERTKPDVVLLDILMPETGGIEVLKTVSRRWPDVKVVMLTTSEREEDVYQAVENGAVGYMLKDLPPEEMIAAIKSVASGGRFFPKSIQNVYAAGKSSERLTDREHELLRLMERGLSNSDMSGALGISANTVKMHVQNILNKLDVTNRTEAVFAAVRRGLL